jgi:hypothetical protein
MKEESPPPLGRFMSEGNAGVTHRTHQTYRLCIYYARFIAFVHGDLFASLMVLACCCLP